MTNDLTPRVAADIAEILERTGFTDESDVQARYERLTAALTYLGVDLQEFAQGIVDILASMLQHFRRLGILPYDPLPQHAYRQTAHGRVPRLTASMRQRQRELRISGGRR